MPKKAMETLTETMFYVLMVFQKEPMCGIDASNEISRRSGGRLRLGPATLYTILARFLQEKYIEELQVEGHKRTYAVTDKGKHAYQEELLRLRRCLEDAEKGDFHGQE